jgi:pimeloyl-ACP methyl ester carboxylesterase
MSIVFGILVLLCGAAAAVVLLSYAFAWCEFANGLPAAMKDRFAPKRLGLAAWLLVLETACLLLNLLQHPLGWYSPRERPHQGQRGTPVLLLHGLFLNRACWYWLRLRLRLRGVRNVYALNLPPWKDVESLTERVSKKVDELRHATGLEQVHLVGHSMGGMIARNYLQIRGGANKVGHCVLLGAPNHGSRLAPFAISPMGELLIPGSDFLAQLATAPIPAEARMTNIYTRHENMVLPAPSAHLPGVKNIELAGMGHHGLLYHPRSVRAVLDALQQEEP